MRPRAVFAAVDHRRAKVCQFLVLCLDRALIDDHHYKAEETLSTRPAGAPSPQTDSALFRCARRSCRKLPALPVRLALLSADSQLPCLVSLFVLACRGTDSTPV